MEEGDIIVSSEKGYALSSVAYDTKIVGVVTLSPAISLKTAGTKRGFPVVSQGGAVVKVTDAGGNIKMGDFITTSETPGTGMKAVENGYVLGEAGENVNFKKKGEIKLIKVSINPRSMSSSTRLNNPLLDVFKIGSIAASDKPGKVLQYVVASLIILVTFGCGFFIFAKTVITGLEAIGRNPLAGRMIQVSIVFNIIMIIVVIIAGTGLAYLVIRL
ncbi:MAG TPA: hypothetical protein VNA13_02710 [Xanthomonadales bacterium]|nr:hypothetical protein [Xanthomonadales bacterium]